MSWIISLLRVFSSLQFPFGWIHGHHATVLQEIVRETILQRETNYIHETKRRIGGVNHRERLVQ